MDQENDRAYLGLILGDGWADEHVSNFKILIGNTGGRGARGCRWEVSVRCAIGVSVLHANPSAPNLSGAIKCDPAIGFLTCYEGRFDGTIYPADYCLAARLEVKKEIKQFVLYWRFFFDDGPSPGGLASLAQTYIATGDGRYYPAPNGFSTVVLRLTSPTEEQMTAFMISRS